MADARYSSQEKACTSCNQVRQLDDFRRCSEIRRGQVYEYQKRICLTCEHEKRTSYRRIHRMRENAVRRTNATYAKYRSGNLKKNYGLTLADYEAMLKSQNYQCAICGREDNENHRSGRKIPLVVDHNHTTGKVRGLLCGSCNRGLGDFRESTSAMVKAIKYLRSH